MDNRRSAVHDRRMRPFRMVGVEVPGAALSIPVIGYRMALPEPVVTDAAVAWFCFHFHHPVVCGTRAGEQTLPAGTVLLIAPGEPIAHRPQGTVLERSWLRCAGPAVAPAVAEAGLRTRVPYVLGADAEALAVLLELHRACVHPRGTTPGLLLARLRTWLHTVARDAGPAPAGLAGIEAVRRQLETSYLLPQRLDHLAGVAGCSRAQLCRRFRRAVGCSPLQYVLRLRLEAARDLLLTTGRDIPAIAEDCGFSDRYHLSRAFSARFGMGPAACRRAGR